MGHEKEKNRKEKSSNYRKKRLSSSLISFLFFMQKYVHVKRLTDIQTYIFSSEIVFLSFLSKNQVSRNRGTRLARIKIQPKTDLKQFESSQQESQVVSSAGKIGLFEPMPYLKSIWIYGNHQTYDITMYNLSINILFFYFNVNF